MAQPQESEWSFQSSVELMATRSGQDHLYPRPDLHDLFHFLRSADTLIGDSASLDPTASTATWDAKDSLVVVHEVETGEYVPFGTTRKDLRTFMTHNNMDSPSLVFLRGYASSQWLNVVGQKHGVSPELYRRHLDLRAFSAAKRDLCISPGLPSSSTRVFQLTIPTICMRNIDGAYGSEDLQSARQELLEQMRTYFKFLPAQAHLVDSVVRKCLLFRKEAYVVEQTISVEVARHGNTWRAIVWLDSGRDLSQSVNGPWLPSPQATFAWETYFFPVIVGSVGASPGTPSTSSQPNEAFSQSLSGTTAHGAAQLGSHHGSSSGWKAAQNICMLPFQYGAELDKYIASKDALYALSELFRFAASAEVQFLNFLHKCIENEISSVDSSHDARRRHYAIPLVNLKYIKSQLALHLQGLAETMTILENRQWLDWPSVTDDEEEGEKVRKTAEKTAVLLLTDFQQLQQRAEALARECEQGMTTLANASVLEESRRSAENAMRVQRLTVLATVFIPLSFVCAVWGMNFKEMGTGDLSLWWWLITAAPVLILSVGIYHSERLGKTSKKLWEVAGCFK